jgi:hypothetical protein
VNLFTPSSSSTPGECEVGVKNLKASVFGSAERSDSRAEERLHLPTHDYGKNSIPSVTPEAEYEEEHFGWLRINDREQMTNFYYLAFHLFERENCCSLANNFIELIESRKQVHHPHTCKEEMRPDWWPKDVPHRVPDYLVEEGKTLPKTGYEAYKIQPISSYWST